MGSRDTSNETKIPIPSQIQGKDSKRISDNGGLLLSPEQIEEAKQLLSKKNSPYLSVQESKLPCTVVQFEGSNDLYAIYSHVLTESDLGSQTKLIQKITGKDSGKWYVCHELISNAQWAKDSYEKETSILKEIGLWLGGVKTSYNNQTLYIVGMNETPGMTLTEIETRTKTQPISLEEVLSIITASVKAMLLLKKRRIINSCLYPEDMRFNPDLEEISFTYASSLKDSQSSDNDGRTICRTLIDFVERIQERIQIDNPPNNITQTLKAIILAIFPKIQYCTKLNTSSLEASSLEEFTKNLEAELSELSAFNYSKEDWKKFKTLKKLETLQLMKNVKALEDSSAGEVLFKQSAEELQRLGLDDWKSLKGFLQELSKDLGWEEFLQELSQKLPQDSSESLDWEDLSLEDLESLERKGKDLYAWQSKNLEALKGKSKNLEALKGSLSFKDLTSLDAAIKELQELCEKYPLTKKNENAEKLKQVEIETKQKTPSIGVPGQSSTQIKIETKEVTQKQSATTSPTSTQSSTSETQSVPAQKLQTQPQTPPIAAPEQPITQTKIETKEVKKPPLKPKPSVPLKPKPSVPPKKPSTLPTQSSTSETQSVPAQKLQTQSQTPPIAAPGQSISQTNNQKPKPPVPPKKPSIIKSSTEKSEKPEVTQTKVTNDNLSSIRSRIALFGGGKKSGSSTKTNTPEQHKSGETRKPGTK